MPPDDVISHEPVASPHYDPKNPGYWQIDLLDLEITRVFEACHECRRCIEYCDSFPTLFDFVDAEPDNDVRNLTAGQVEQVVDACFQCKLCEVHCPYTPREDHELQIDVPRLVHRYRAVRARGRGLTARDRALGNPDALGQLARLSFGLANLLNGMPPFRGLLERFLGIHAEKRLPDFAAESFEGWARLARVTASAGQGHETVLFATCFVNEFEPQIGRDTLEVFERNQLECKVVTDGGCCGMAAWESGDLARLERLAEHLLDRVHPHVEAGAKLVVLQPACARMIRDDYPELLDDPRAKAVAEAVVDPSELLWSIRDEPRFDSDFRSSPPGGTVAYHASCHQQARRVGLPARDLLQMIPDTTVETVTACCGHGGTYAAKVERFEAASRVGESSLAAMQEVQAEVWASECGLAGLQFAQNGGRPSLHPVSVLARAYREDGFRELPDHAET